jgi:dipeptidyl aminopeptidase/acylaminoacyl peptidase
MNKLFLFSSGALLVAAALLSIRYGFAQKAPLIPKKALFGNPVIAMVKISPDGKHLSYIAPHNGVLNVYVRSIDKDDARVITADTYRGIRSYFWLYDNETIVYQQDKGGDENFHLYATNINSKETTELTPFEGAKAMLVAYDKKKPGAALIALNKENKALFDVYEIDFTTKALTLVAKNPGNVGGWHATDSYEIIAATLFNPDGTSDIRSWNHATQELGDILVHWSLDEVTVGGALGVTDRKTLYLADPRNSNTARLVELNTETKELNVLYENARYDVEHALIDPLTDRVFAVPLSAALPELIVIDPAYADEIQFLKKQFHPAEITISSYTKKFDNWVIAVGSDVKPASYYLYHRPTRTLTFLYDARPELSHYKMAEMKPFSVTVRDGMVLEGYITLPLGASLPAPTILYVHGGPWARDEWGFNAAVQWLVNRGYAVIQVNYRSSTGYGKHHVKAGNKEWGGKMQDDLTDTVQWAINQGYADKNKVGIMGGSYGGYATLAGLAFTPDLYACGVDIVGVSNLLTFMKSIPPYWGIYLEMLRLQVGDMQTEEEFLRSRSPVYSAHRIVAPLLIGQGANDPRVVKAESDQMVEALKARGVDVEYIVYDDEGHGFARPENRLDFYQKTESFLAKYLGGRVEA